MTSINTALNSYYQLSNSSSGSTTTGSGTSATDLTDTLAQMLSQPDSPADSSNSDAYLLDLSPQAQQLMSGLGTTGTSSTDSSITGSNGSFLLTDSQQQAITNIITKYKDAPYTQDTYNSIQNDLQAAGLDANTLTMKDQAQSFNPTMVLISALSGSTTLDTGVPSASDEQTKSTNYMQQILSQWQTISGNTGTPSSGTDSSDAAASGSVTPAGATAGA